MHGYRHDDLPIQKHKPSISFLKKLIEVSGIFIIGTFPLKFGSMKLLLYSRSFENNFSYVLVDKGFDDYFV
jgi:hypothetical protein